MFRSFLKLVQSQRAIDRGTLLGAALYALQSVMCMGIILYIYGQFELGSAMWAGVSAVLVLQPGLEQSYGASATRFVSNLTGALTGAIVDKLHGHGAADVVVALILVVAFCEALRLDQGLRSACASVLIVMMGGTAVSHAMERRVLAVVIGCSTALLVRMLTERIQRLLPATARRGDSTQVDEG